MFPLLKQSQPQEGVPFCFLRDLRKCKCPNQSREELGTDNEIVMTDESIKREPDLSDYVIVESRKSQATPVTPAVPSGSRLTKSSSFRFEDDELWIVSVENENDDSEKLKERRNSTITGIASSDTSSDGSKPCSQNE